MAFNEISWDMQFLRYASPSNGGRYNTIKPQATDGYVRCPKQLLCISRKSANLSSRKNLSCHSCLGSLHHIFNNLAHKCSFICTQMTNGSSDWRTYENGTPIKTSNHFQPLSGTFLTGFRTTNSAPQLQHIFDQPSTTVPTALRQLSADRQAGCW